MVNPKSRERERESLVTNVQQKEEATKKIVELSEEAKQRMCALERNKSEYGKAKAELKKVSEEVLHQRKEEKELEAMYKKNVCNFIFLMEFVHDDYTIEFILGLYRVEL